MATTLRTLIDSAKTAIAANNYSLAANLKAQIDLELLGTPDTKADGEELRWGREASAALGTWLDKKATASTGLQFVRATFNSASTS